MKKAYLVTEITGYSGWGQEYFGKTLKKFYNLEKARQYCIDTYGERYTSSWPSVTILEEGKKYYYG